MEILICFNIFHQSGSGKLHPLFENLPTGQAGQAVAFRIWNCRKFETDRDEYLRQQKKRKTKMASKKIIMKFNLSVVMLSFFLIAHSQDIICELKITNEEVSFSVFRYGMDFTAKTKPKSNMVIETNIKDVVLWKRIKSLPTEQWLCLLNNPKSDWVANLILYQLYEKEAILFSQIKKREDWIGFRRDEDIAYWKTFLTKTKKN